MLPFGNQEHSPSKRAAMFIPEEQKRIFIDAEDGSSEVKLAPVGKSWFLCEKNWGTSPSLILSNFYVIFIPLNRSYGCINQIFIVPFIFPVNIYTMAFICTLY